MNSTAKANAGVTLIELLLILAALAVLAIVFLSFGQSRRLANLELCQTKLQALGVLENQCLADIRAGVNPCPFCIQFNSQLTTLFAGACKDLDAVPATYTCPATGPLAPGSGFPGGD